MDTPEARIMFGPWTRWGLGRYFKQHPNATCCDFVLPVSQLPQLIPYDKRLRFLVRTKRP